MDPSCLYAQGSVSCAGQITANIAYSGDPDIMPKCLLVKETVTATWGGSSGSASDGWNGSASSTAPGGSITTTKYSVKTNPGATFTTSCSPTASGSLPQQVNDIMTASASVYYKIVLTPDSALPVADRTKFGCEWKIWVNDPDGYGGEGGWNIVQLITPKRHHIRSDSTLADWSINGAMDMLDSAYPYEPLRPIQNSTPTVAEITWPADGTEIADGDSPLTSTDMASELGAILDESYKTYAMYIPPGSGSQFVPLRRFDWTLKMKIKNENGQWQVDTAYSSFGPNPGTSVIENTHPTWTQKFSSPDYTYNH